MVSLCKTALRRVRIGQHLKKERRKTGGGEKLPTAAGFWCLPSTEVPGSATLMAFLGGTASDL